MTVRVSEFCGKILMRYDDIDMVVASVWRSSIQGRIG
jgi:hypothetical protein